MAFSGCFLIHFGDIWIELIFVIHILLKLFLTLQKAYWGIRVVQLRHTYAWKFQFCVWKYSHFFRMPLYESHWCAERFLCSNLHILWFLSSDGSFWYWASPYPQSLRSYSPDGIWCYESQMSGYWVWFRERLTAFYQPSQSCFRCYSCNLGQSAFYPLLSKMAV